MKKCAVQHESTPSTGPSLKRKYLFLGYMSCHLEFLLLKFSFVSSSSTESQKSSINVSVRLSAVSHKLKKQTQVWSVPQIWAIQHSKLMWRRYVLSTFCFHKREVSREAMCFISKMGHRLGLENKTLNLHLLYWPPRYSCQKKSTCTKILKCSH